MNHNRFKRDSNMIIHNSNAHILSTTHETLYKSTLIRQVVAGRPSQLNALSLVSTIVHMYICTYILVHAYIQVHMYVYPSYNMYVLGTFITTVSSKPKTKFKEKKLI